MMEHNKTEQRNWTVLDLIQWSTKYLSDKGFDDARLNVELLLSHVLNCKRIDLYLRYDMLLKPDELTSYRELFKRRLSHEPLQYILGKTDFMSLTFVVKPGVLIPRPETEVLVEIILSTFKQHAGDIIRFLDIGVGSGCIAVSIAKYIPNAIVEAIDISDAALEVAKVNIRNYHLEDRISLMNADILDNLPKFQNYPFDVLVSNPPYISKDEFDNLQPEIKEFEPNIASTDFANGLTFFKVIADKGKSLLRHGGLVFVEIGYNQSKDVIKIFRDANYKNIEVFRDYSNLERVIKAQVN